MMSEADRAQTDRARPDRDEEDLVVEEAEEAGSEAARIGGPAPDDEGDDPAERPLAEAGEGEAEGFELAEKRLEDVASHGDQHRFPDRDAPDAEEPGGEFGEADEEIPDDE